MLTPKHVLLLSIHPRPQVQAALTGEVIQVETEARLLQELAHGQVDLVIVDAAFDPTRVLNLTSPAYVPVIMVAEQGNIAQAVSAIKAGVEDYLVMDADFHTRLVAAVDQCVWAGMPATLFYDIYDDAPVMMFLFNQDGIILDVNNQCLRELGYTVDKLVGQSIITLLTTESARKVEIGLSQLWRDGWASNLVYQCRTQNGDVIDVLLNCQTLQAIADMPVAIAVMRNITHQKQIEFAEHEQRALSEALRDTTVALTSTLNFDEVLDRILANVARVVPYDTGIVFMLVEDGLARLVRNQRWTDLGREINVPTIDFPLQHTPTLRQMYATGQALAIPDTSAYADWVDLPQTRWVRSFVGAPIREGDEVIGFLNLNSGQRNTFTDEHAERLQAFANQAAIAIRNARLFDAVQRHAEELERRVTERTAQLNVERNQLHAILESTGEGIFYTENHVIRYVNPAFTRLTGYAPQDIIGQPMSALQQADDDQWQAVQAVVEQGRIWRAELRLRRKDNTVFDAGLTIAPGNHPDSKPLRTVAVVRDVSQEKALQDQKSRFIANASHELRTPIQNIITRLYLMNHQPERMADHIAIIDEVTERMRHLIEDLLDLSRFERGVIPLERRPVNLQQLIQGVIEVQQADAQLKRIHLAAQVTEPSLQVMGDAERLGQVITNLVVNALNYTPVDGKVKVDLVQEDGHAIISITDTGIGIDPARLEHIFEPFVRIHEDRQGSGLGLSISKEIVEMHGGKIDVASQPGQGSCFKLSLLLAPAVVGR